LKIALVLPCGGELTAFFYRASSSPHITSSPGNGGGVSSPSITSIPNNVSPLTLTNSGSVTTAVSTTASPTSSQGVGGGGYSTSDKIALGVGLGVGIPTFLATVFFGIPACINAMKGT
jgi:hypothetical protein